MPSKHRPISYRPPADTDLRAWLRDFAKRTGRAVNAVITDALSEYRAAHDKEEAMSTWVIEFAAPSISAARDIARRCAPAGWAEPSVSEAGRLGYEVASSDYGFIERIAAAARGYGKPVISRR